MFCPRERRGAPVILKGLVPRETSASARGGLCNKTPRFRGFRCIHRGLALGVPVRARTKLGTAAPAVCRGTPFVGVHPPLNHPKRNP